MGIARPAGITALGIFFLAGAVIASMSAVSLLQPGGPLEPMWRVNPRAREAFAGLGLWAVGLMVAVALSCASAAVGLWRGSRWGYLLSIGLIALNLAGDIVNVTLGIERRAVVGIPIAAAIIAYLSSRGVRRFFSGSTC